MKRLLILLAVLALTAAACSGSSSTAATVNGTDITTGDVDDLFYEPEEDLSDQEMAGYLSTLIQWTAIEQAAEADLGFEATQEDIDAEVETILFDQGYAGDLDGFLEEQNISEEGLERYATQLLIEDAVIESVTPTLDMPTVEDAQEAIDAAPLEFTQVCASHILVETEAEADAVIERLDGGEDFATVAAEVSIDTGSGTEGGSLGCGAAATYVPAFAEATVNAPIGEVTDPVETEFGFHVIVVEERSVATPEEVLPFMEEQVIFAATDTWLLDAVQTAEVTVDEQYGTWQTEPTPQVVPPAA
ncbi:MAG: peptidylprolyl isomerase [Acidimicrobiia bacterium]